MQSSRFAVRWIHAAMLKRKREQSGGEFNLPDRKQATRRYIHPQRAFRSRSLTLACRQIEREDSRGLRAREMNVARNSRSVQLRADPTAGQRLGEKP